MVSNLTKNALIYYSTKKKLCVFVFTCIYILPFHIPISLSYYSRVNGWTNFNDSFSIT